eukprot:Mycagemm_TRINITY_DN9923_c0_g2::TRINITY_DN9923_c0_g2_i1::g.3394::m.3394 type:complete len:124 gc:universal TRINITY_DN9923_c0_g2_i1:75-446(+)
METSSTSVRTHQPSGHTRVPTRRSLTSKAAAFCLVLTTRIFTSSAKPCGTTVNCAGTVSPHSSAVWRCSRSRLNELPRASGCESLVDGRTTSFRKSVSRLLRRSMQPLAPCPASFCASTGLLS